MGETPTSWGGQQQQQITLKESNFYSCLISISPVQPDIGQADSSSEKPRH